MLSVVIEIGVILTFSVLIRLLFGLSFKRSMLDDSYNHLFYIKTQQNKKYFDFTFYGALIKSKIAYPRFQHFIISRFPQRKWFLVGNILIIFYDIVQVVLVYGLSKYLFEVIHVDQAVNTTMILSPAGWSALLFSSTPALFPVSARLTGLGNARTIGNLFVFLLMFVWMFIQLNGFFYLLPVAFLLVCLIILTSQFALQTMLFNFIFLSIFYLSIIPILFVVLSIVIAFFLPIGVNDILYFKFNHWKWFFKNAQEGTTVNNRNKVKDFIYLPVYFVKDINFFLYKIINHLTPAILLYSVPSIIIYFVNWGVFEGNLFLTYFNYIFLASLLSFGLTSLKPFSFLGEAERYMEYSMSFLSVLIVELMLLGHISEKMLMLLFIIHLSIIFFIFTYRNQKYLPAIGMKEEDKNEVLEPLIQFLKPEKEVNVLVVPIKHSRYLAYKTFEIEHIKFYQRFMNPEKGYESFTKETKKGSIEIPITDISFFKKKYNVNYLLFLKSFEAFNEDLLNEFNVSRLELVFENETYLLFKV